MGHSKGFRNRNQMIDPPTKESLQAGLEDSQLLKLSQRILDGKAVVSNVIQIQTHPSHRFDFSPLTTIFFAPFRSSMWSMTEHLLSSMRISGVSSSSSRYLTRKTSPNGSNCRRTQTSSQHLIALLRQFRDPSSPWWNLTMVATFSTTSRVLI